MKLLQSEINYIKKEVEGGEALLSRKDWCGIQEKLGDLQLDIGYTDSTYDRINDTGRYIERLIDKIAYDEGDERHT